MQATVSDDELYESGHQQHELFMQLMDAIEKDDVATVDALLRRGATPYLNAVPNGVGFSRSPIAVAVSCGSQACVKRLLKAKADPWYKQKEDCPPLLAACEHGRVEMVQLLVDAGALAAPSGIAKGRLRDLHAVLSSVNVRAEQRCEFKLNQLHFLPPSTC